MRRFLHVTAASALVLALANACSSSARNFEPEGEGGSGAGGAPTSCATPDDCPAPRSECLVASCEKEACGAGFTAKGAACSQGVCDGKGACVECITAADCPAPEACGIARCDGGACVVDPEKGGTPCGAGKVCNDTAKCVDCYGDQDCNGTNEFCATSGECLSRCFDKMLDGTETDVDCGGTGLFGCPGKPCGCQEICAYDEDCEGGYCYKDPEDAETGLCFCD